MIVFDDLFTELRMSANVDVTLVLEGKAAWTIRYPVETGATVEDLKAVIRAGYPLPGPNMDMFEYTHCKGQSDKLSDSTVISDLSEGPGEPISIKMEPLSGKHYLHGRGTPHHPILSENPLSKSGLASFLEMGSDVNIISSPQDAPAPLHKVPLIFHATHSASYPSIQEINDAISNAGNPFYVNCYDMLLTGGFYPHKEIMFLSPQAVEQISTKVPLRIPRVEKPRLVGCIVYYIQRSILALIATVRLLYEELIIRNRWLLGVYIVVESSFLPFFSNSAWFLRLCFGIAFFANRYIQEIDFNHYISQFIRRVPLPRTRPIQEPRPQEPREPQEPQERPHQEPHHESRTRRFVSGIMLFVISFFPPLHNVWTAETQREVQVLT